MKSPIVLLSLVLVLAAAMSAQSGDLALTHGRVYSSPTSEAIDDATVLVHEGVISWVGRQREARIPKSVETIDCTGKVVVAGFWNSHVHFQTGWENANEVQAPKLASLMREMLTKWGFTTVWDLGSPPPNTQAIRDRVEKGEIPGVKILMAGDIFPKNGHPVYLPPEMQLTEAGSPQEATQEAHDYLQGGLDGIKLFTGAYMGTKPVVVMDTAIVKAAVDVSHAQGKPVFTHPQNKAGLENSLNGGVDVLAHTIPTEGKYTDGELAQMKRQHVALIPTLTLWTIVFPNPTTQNRSTIEAGVNELRQYSSGGGTILFGTDVGFQSQYDTTPEFELMGQAMSWREILASLTTNPSAFFQAGNEGRVEKGMKANLVVLDADPATDVRNFSKVAYTFRNGKLLYSR
jgi:imidazolonepropionase-like amidohydrolase